MICVCFSHDGKKLLSVSTDNSHTITLWDWAAPEGKQVLAVGKGYNGDPPQVYGVVWNQYRGDQGASPYDFVSFGANHLLFWTYDSAAR